MWAGGWGRKLSAGYEKWLKGWSIRKRRRKQRRDAETVTERCSFREPLLHVSLKMLAEKQTDFNSTERKCK